MPPHTCHSRSHLFTATWAAMLLLAVVLAGTGRTPPDLRAVAVGAGPVVPENMLAGGGGADPATRPEALGPAKRSGPVLLAGAGPRDDAFYREARLFCPSAGGAAMPAAAPSHCLDQILPGPRQPTGPPC